MSKKELETWFLTVSFWPKANPIHHAFKFKPSKEECGEETFEVVLKSEYDAIAQEVKNMSKYTYTDSQGVEHTAEHADGVDAFPKLGTPKDLRDCILRIATLPLNRIHSGAGDAVLVDYLNNRFGAAMCDDDAINQRLLDLLERIKTGKLKKEKNGE